MQVNDILRQRFGVSLQCLSMTPKKDAPLAFRIPTELKQELQRISDKEARSLSQICEAFLRGGLVAYQKEGAKYLSRLLSPEHREK